MLLTRDRSEIECQDVMMSWTLLSSPVGHWRRLMTMAYWPSINTVLQEEYLGFKVGVEASRPPTLYAGPLAFEYGGGLPTVRHTSKDGGWRLHPKWTDPFDPDHDKVSMKQIEACVFITAVCAMLFARRTRTDGLDRKGISSFKAYALAPSNQVETLPPRYDCDAIVVCGGSILNTERTAPVRVYAPGHQDVLWLLGETRPRILQGSARPIQNRQTQSRPARVFWRAPLNTSMAATAATLCPSAREGTSVASRQAPIGVVAGSGP